VVDCMVGNVVLAIKEALKSCRVCCHLNAHLFMKTGGMVTFPNRAEVPKHSVGMPFQTKPQIHIFDIITKIDMEEIANASIIEGYFSFSVVMVEITHTRKNIHVGMIMKTLLVNALNCRINLM
jgi:hypothetical protein